MGHKVFDITNNAVSKYDILSQTPENFNRDNYFIKELQDKVNADWKYRPNRVKIEFEENWGRQKYSPIEVVMQSIKSDKGKDISNDCRRIVFKDISEDRFKIGSKFRFSPKYNFYDSENRKNVWLVTNLNTVKATSGVVIERCNGNIGSTYIDSQGVTQFHYEPVIQGRELQGTNFRYGDPIVAPQSQLIITCQHNEFTKRYYINQRFIIGYNEDFSLDSDRYIQNNFTAVPSWKINYYYEKQDVNGEETFILLREKPQDWNDLVVCNSYYHKDLSISGKGKGKVYRLTAINKYYSDSTFNVNDVGLIRMYLELTESSYYDDFNTRIAYQMSPTVHLSTTEGGEGDYKIIFNTPEYIPTDLTSSILYFTPVVATTEGVKNYEIPIHVQVSLERLPETVDINNYIEFIKEDNSNNFTLKRKKMYLNGDLIVNCYVDEEDSPTGQSFDTSFSLVMRRSE